MKKSEVNFNWCFKTISARLTTTAPQHLTPDVTSVPPGNYSYNYYINSLADFQSICKQPLIEFFFSLPAAFVHIDKFFFFHRYWPSAIFHGKRNTTNQVSSRNKSRSLITMMNSNPETQIPYIFSPSLLSRFFPLLFCAFLFSSWCLHRFVIRIVVIGHSISKGTPKTE